MEQFPILSLMILLPLLSAMFIATFVKQSRNPAKVLYAKYVAILASVLTFICSIFLLIGYEHQGPNSGGYQFQEFYNFIPQIGLDIELAIDGISIFFVFLVALLTLISISISMLSITKSIKEFLVCFLLLESFLLGAFCANNLLLFYICFEAVLIPLFLIIGIWGGEDKTYSAFKLFLYTFFGSVFFLMDVVYLFQECGTLSMPALAKIAPYLPLETQLYLWLGAFIAFSIKIPMIPFHTWLPDAHVQAPTSGSIMLAGILLKIGSYGFIRVLISMFPAASIYFAHYVLVMSIIAIIYGSLVAIKQTDMKKMIAYASVAHMGYVTGGLFSFNLEGLSGGIMQMISHGFVSSGLFMVIGFLYDRTHTKQISAYGGASQPMPILSGFFMILTLASVGLPGTSGFVGEFYSLVGMYNSSFDYSFFGSFGMVLGAIYMLRLYRDVMLGEVTSPAIAKCPDLNTREIISILPLAIATIFIGIFPGFISQYYNNDIALILTKIGMAQ